MNTREAIKVYRQLADAYTDLESMVSEKWAENINVALRDAQRAIAWQLVHMVVDFKLAPDENSAVFEDNDIPF